MSKMFSIKPQVLKTPEQAYAELLGNSEENQIVDIDISLIDEIDNQPQKIHDDKINRIAESMKIVGQLDPVIVVPSVKKKGRYILIAGRHRKRACVINGLNKVKAVIKKENDPDKQRLMLLATNNDRNTDYSPSELAFSYLEQMELLKKLGSKSTASQIAEENNTNRKTVHKYIQLTKLIQPLLSRVDNGTITVGAGYELSFLSPEQQSSVFNFILNHSDKSNIEKNTARQIRIAPDDLQNIFYPPVDEPSLINYDDGAEDNTQKSLKAEKKINSNTNDKCPSEGQLNIKIPKIHFEELMTIAYIVKKEAYSILAYIISNYPTTKDVTELINAKYVKSDISFKGVLNEGNNTPFYTYLYADYEISFKKSLRLSSQLTTVKKKLLS